MTRIIRLWSLLFLFPLSLSAEVVYLQDGSKINGSVKSSDGSIIELETSGGILKIKKSDIERIDYQTDTEPASVVPQKRNDARPMERETLDSSVGRSGNHMVLKIGQKQSNDESEAGLYLEGGLMTDIGTNGSLGVAIGLSKFDNKVNTLSKGEITMVPLLGKVRLSATPQRTSVFFEGGLGYYIFDHTLDSELDSALASIGLTLEEEIDPTFGGFVGLGVDVEMASNAALGLSVERHFVRPDITVTISDGSTSTVVEDDIDLGFTVIAARLVLHF